MMTTETAMTRSKSLLLLILLLLPSIAGADLEDRIEQRWAGSWVLTRLDTRSGCSGFFTDNEVEGRIARSRGDYGFDSGELGRVQEVDLHRGAVDLSILFEESLLIPYQDGPFTLFREATCKVELEVTLDRILVKEEQIEAIDQRLLGLLERHAQRSEAQASDLWNGRQRAPYPADYERTLAEHRTWKAEQINFAVQARLDEAIEELIQLPRLLERDPAYLDGFYAGVAELRHAFFPSCPGLVEHGFYPDVETPPKKFAEQAKYWKAGFHDGQIHAFELRMLRRLPACFVPVPPPLP